VNAGADIEAEDKDGLTGKIYCEYKNGFKSYARGDLSIVNSPLRSRSRPRLLNSSVPPCRKVTTEKPSAVRS